MALNFIPIGSRSAVWRSNNGAVAVKVVALAVAPTEDLDKAPRMWAIGAAGQWMPCSLRPDEGHVEL